MSKKALIVVYLMKQEVQLAFVHISQKCWCLRNTTLGSLVIASYWPLRVCRSINHISLTNSIAFYLTFWNPVASLRDYDRWWWIVYSNFGFEIPPCPKLNNFIHRFLLGIWNFNEKIFIVMFEQVPTTNHKES